MVFVELTNLNRYFVSLPLIVEVFSLHSEAGLCVYWLLVASDVELDFGPSTPLLGVDTFGLGTLVLRKQMEVLIELLTVVLVVVET